MLYTLYLQVATHYICVHMHNRIASAVEVNFNEDSYTVAENDSQVSISLRIDGQFYVPLWAIIEVSDGTAKGGSCKWANKAIYTSGFLNPVIPIYTSGSTCRDGDGGHIHYQHCQALLSFPCDRLSTNPGDYYWAYIWLMPWCLSVYGFLCTHPWELCTHGASNIYNP